MRKSWSYADGSSPYRTRESVKVDGGSGSHHEAHARAHSPSCKTLGRFIKADWEDRRCCKEESQTEAVK